MGEVCIDPETARQAGTAISTDSDYETRPEHHEAMVYIATVMTMSRRSARSTNR